MIQFLRDIFAMHRDVDAIVWQDRPWSYGWLLQRLDEWKTRLESEGVPNGAVVSIEADFSPDGVALFLALLERRCVLVPLTSITRHFADAVIRGLYSSPPAQPEEARERCMT